ncbi:MAG TPA: hypothetical protein VG075_11115 [Candidatus Acidoferrum sp.]|jgi:hypothetical protein|nr:hypothetical protein [Candidatus Acidoferrum sp.]
MFQKKYFSRDEWRERGRVVCVPNSEARDVCLYWENNIVGLKRGAWHVFSEDQTLPVEQYQQVGVAA